MVAGAHQIHSGRKELARPIDVAVVQLDISEVSVLGSEHPIFAELSVQVDALRVQSPRLRIVTPHPERNRHQVNRHPLEPPVARPASQRARFRREGAHLLQLIPSQRHPREHAQTIDLATDETVIAVLNSSRARSSARPVSPERKKISDSS